MKEKIGDSINIPKDFLVKNAEIKICTENGNPKENYKVGDKYIDFTINTKDDSEEEKHLYLLATDLISLKSGNGIKVEYNQIINVKYGTGLKLDSNGNLILDITQVKSDVVGLVDRFKTQGTNGFSISVDNLTTWRSKGNCVWWFTELGQLQNQPSQYGLLLNITEGSNEVHQLWLSQPGGLIYSRGANGNGWANGGKWLKITPSIYDGLDSDSTTDALSANRGMQLADKIDNKIWKKYGTFRKGKYFNPDFDENYTEFMFCVYDDDSDNPYLLNTFVISAEEYRKQSVYADDENERRIYLYRDKTLRKNTDGTYSLIDNSIYLVGTEDSYGEYKMRIMANDYDDLVVNIYSKK